MNTRFDGRHWINAKGPISPAEMDTDYLLNTLKMLVRRPLMVVNMMIRDIETVSASDPSVPWTKDNTDVRAESILNITSMTAEGITSYVLSSPLGQEMQSTLRSRGVNTTNYLELVKAGEQ